jgi:hypothetical protein
MTGRAQGAWVQTPPRRAANGHGVARGAGAEWAIGAKSGWPV